MHIQSFQTFQQRKEIVMRTLLFVLMLAVLIMPCGLFAQQEQGKTPAPAAQAGTKAETPPHPMSGVKMKEHDEMMSRMKEMDARLDAEVAAMDAAKGDQKVEAMAIVIKDMVSQRKEMQDHMMKMHDMRKGHMMEHMKPGMEGEAGKKKDM